MKYRPPRIDINEPRIRIRSRYLEAIRAGANIHDATEYANASEQDRPRFIRINVDIPIAPKGYGKPGETELILPKSMAKIDIKALPSTDPEVESIKRPMTVESPVVAAVVVEPKEAPEAQAAPIELPEGWDTKDYNWQNLRALCLRVATKTPHSRTDAVTLIRKKMLEG